MVGDGSAARRRGRGRPAAIVEMELSGPVFDDAFLRPALAPSSLKPLVCPLFARVAGRWLLGLGPLPLTIGG